MIARIKLSSVHELTALYAMELHFAGRVEGDYLLLPLADANAIRARHNPPKEKIRGLGDVVHKVALPVAKALGLPCVDKSTGKLRPESPCAKRREMLNRAVKF